MSTICLAACLLKGGDIVVMSLTKIDGLDGLMDILIGTSLRLKLYGAAILEDQSGCPIRSGTLLRPKITWIFSN